MKLAQILENTIAHYDVMANKEQLQQVAIRAIDAAVKALDDAGEFLDRESVLEWIRTHYRLAPQELAAVEVELDRQ